MLKELANNTHFAFHPEMDKKAPKTPAQQIMDGGGMLYPYHHGYHLLGELLDALPPEAWRKDEGILGALVMHLVKNGQAVRAKSYLYAVNLEFERTYQYDVLDLLLALHLGEPVSDEKLGGWRRLERSLPLNDPLLLGLYYNAMMAMFVRLMRHNDARTAGQQAISCYREAGHSYLEHFIHIHMADLDVVEGRLRRAARGLKAAERCLEQSGQRYGHEEQVIAVISLAIDYERGHFDRVRRGSAALRNGLMTGDSWSELFYQLARISVMSAYFLEGRHAAQVELDTFQADYTRRHNGRPMTIDVLEARVSYLEWHPSDAERILNAIADIPVHSTIGQGLLEELRTALHLGDYQPPQTPRGAIVAALQRAQALRGKARKQAITDAMRLALEERQIAPFLEYRDVFLGVSSSLASGQAFRGNPPLSRLARQIVRDVERSYVVPEQLKALGFNRRQYRVAAALQSGSTNKQVARQLGTSEATVKYHLTSIYRKAGVLRRGQLFDFMTSLKIFENY